MKVSAALVRGEIGTVNEKDLVAPTSKENKKMKYYHQIMIMICETNGALGSLSDLLLPN